MIKIIFISILTVCLFLYLRWKNKRFISGRVISDKKKKYYNKVAVPMNKLDILTREYYEEIEEENWPSRISTLDSFLEQNHSIKELKQVSVIKYDGLFKNKILRSSPIYLPRMLLEKKLKENGHIDLYYKDDITFEYFFDLSFLNK